MIDSLITGFINMFTKNYTQELGLELRKMYEGAKIVTEQDFKEAMKYVLFGC